MNGHLNPEFMEDWKQLDPESWKDTIGEIISIFLKTAPTQYLELLEMNQSQNFKQLEFLSHSLKSACGTVGLKEGYLLFGIIEEKIRSQNYHVNAEISRLRNIFPEMVEDVQEFKKIYLA